MIVRLIAVDRIRTPYVARACEDFRARLRPYYAYDEIEVRAGSGKDPSATVRDETERIARQLGDGERYWLLDRSGTQLSSEALARRLDAVARDGAQRLTLVIGGTFGTGKTLRERAEFVWSLSDLTFLHEWARIIVLEQLYRAAKILRNEPYHH
ncbi:MAG: 23S rRNA (pseudouridine(1915)-N(3))-methyltransferase RlmH [Candidatus Eremiobacteraeota bacterium]|nr:23S rRNA (pseudouridine(1915)-N(3))-methyltransferase RlmH [Candidatus Eremiobacteraeota bacterium]